MRLVDRDLDGQTLLYGAADYIVRSPSWALRAERPESKPSGAPGASWRRCFLTLPKPAVVAAKARLVGTLLPGI